MGRVGDTMGMALLVVAMAVWMSGAAEAQQFSMMHGYAHLEGSPAQRGDQSMSPEYYETLRTHDRRRLAVVADFPLVGDDDVYTTGLYYTQITLGTPPVNFYVQVDTGSDVLWLNCAPCPGCARRTTLPGVSLKLYDPVKSSTDKVLGCRASDCAVASKPEATKCYSSDECAYEIKYGDGSSTSGYILSDVLTFTQIENSTSVNATATVYFGCGVTQTGNLLTESRALDGLIGFGPAAISVSSQLASQGKVGRMFAHCLQGDKKGGGTMVIGTILEPNITYTPIVPEQFHYSLEMQNIAVNGRNITTAASFAVTLTGGGVIMDSGTTLAYLVEPAYSEFIAAISSAAPVPVTQIRSGSTTQACWVYGGVIATSFPTVELLFGGGAVMSLTARNYLYATPLQSGQTAYCMGWLKSSSSYTIFGDIVLKDQLVVYDNDKKQVGWRPFDCTKPIRVRAPNSTTPVTVLPGSGLGSSGAQAAPGLSPLFSSSCVALALLWTLL